MDGRDVETSCNGHRRRGAEEQRRRGRERRRREGGGSGDSEAHVVAVDAVDAVVGVCDGEVGGVKVDALLEKTVGVCHRVCRRERDHGARVRRNVLGTRKVNTKDFYKNMNGLDTWTLS